MSDPATSCALFALFSFGGGEVILVLALMLILLGAKKLPDIARGLGEGFFEFRKHVGGFAKELDQEAHDAGESLGGIYGKPAAEALTPDNQTADSTTQRSSTIPARASTRAFESWSDCVG